MPVWTKLVTARHGHCKYVLAAAEVFLCDAIIVPMTRGLLGSRMGLGAELAGRSQLPVTLIERPARRSAAPSGARLAGDLSVLEVTA